jgi:hypothetical protein
MWGANLVRALVQTTIGDHDFLGESTVPALADLWQRRTTGVCLLFGDCPERKIVDLVIAGRSPIILFAEDPIDIVGYAIEERNLSVRNAASLVNQCLAVFHDLFLRGDVLVVERSGTVSVLIERIASTLGLQLSTEQRLAVARQVGVDITGQALVANEVERYGKFARRTGYWATHLDASDLNTALSLAAPFAGIYRGERLVAMEWPPHLFFSADTPGQALVSHLSMLGPARILAYGPYLHLPPGEWVANVEFEVGDNASGNSLFADVVVGNVLRGALTKLPSSGEFQFEMPFAITEPRTPIELRLAIKEGAIEGWLDLKMVTLTRRAAPL